MRFCKQTIAQAFDDSLKFKGIGGFVFPPFLSHLGPKKTQISFQILDLITYNKKKPSFEKCQILQQKEYIIGNKALKWKTTL